MVRAGRRVRSNIKTNSPDRSNFALDFVPDIGDARLQWNPHNPLGTVFKLDEITDVIAPIRSISKYPAGLERIVLGS